ncbi:helix-turn-helix transcriptional regulator [Agrobacterium fabrum]|jgi:AraC-like DNA-binding protein|uniref:helix-turn-helix transcriptional regulator n=1 Tax=Agrobacterium fabrum TaxID=1176649 RepID=UPI00273E738B|nr:AraC family transcriptional regulator [Agrobacterium fabrum]WLP54962.1 AraC family transcriptional regulator [Agrobacterium fabrum]
MTVASADIRTYRQERPRERHGFVQIVLPVSGHLRIDVAGRQDELSTGRGVFIHRDAPHTQEATDINHSLVVDIDESVVSERTLEKFARTPFLDIAPDTRQLITYMRGLIGTDGRRDDVTGLWAPILVDSLANERADIRKRLRWLGAVVGAEPFFLWTIDMLAACASISESRLHALFIEEFGLSPHRWLVGLRMDKVCKLLRESSLPIAEIALRSGFSDQTALTRALRNAVGETPAAYRRNRGIH